jgi:hypothetical protein
MARAARYRNTPVGCTVRQVAARDDCAHIHRALKQNRRGRIEALPRRRPEAESDRQPSSDAQEDRDRGKHRSVKTSASVRDEGVCSQSDKLREDVCCHLASRLCCGRVH